MKRSETWSILLGVTFILLVGITISYAKAGQESYLLKSPRGDSLSELKKSVGGSLEIEKESDISPKIITRENIPAMGTGEVPTIYIVLGIDTETGYSSQWPTMTVPYHATGEPSESSILPSLDSTWRATTEDSLGDGVKITWYLLSDEMDCQSTSGNCLKMYDAFMAHEDQVNAIGDELAWHYHNRGWVLVENQPYDGLWSHLFTFDGTFYTEGTDVEFAEKMLNQMIIEKNYFPENFRSGWTWEDNDYSNWLENILLYDYSNLAPLVSGDLDWSRAPIWPETMSYNPSTLDYQTPGAMNRMIIQCDINLPQGGNEEKMDIAIEKALAGEDSIYCLYTHGPSGAVNSLADSVNALVQDKKQEYDDSEVIFKYATATEAIQSYVGTSDKISPTLDIDKQGNFLVVKVNEPIFNDYPYLALKFVDGSYGRLHGVLASENTYEYDLGALQEEEIETVGAAAVDVAGNAGTLVRTMAEITAPEPSCQPAYYDKQRGIWMPGNCG